VFSAATAAVSQLVGTRRRCLGVVGTGLGASYLLRAVADGSVHGHAIIWISPLGWVEQLSAYNNHPWVAVGSLLGAAVTAAAAAVVVRSRRDTGDGAWPVRAQVRRDRGIRSLTRLHVVLERGALLGWTGGMAATGLMLGFIAADIAKVAAENPTLSKLDSVAGTSVASIRGFLGLSFELIAVLAARRQEETRTLENLLTAGAGRQAWLGVRLAGALLSVALVTGVTGLAVWAGVQLSGQPLPVSDALRGAANTLPVSALFLGASTLTLGLRPRAVAAVAYSSVGLSYAGLLVAVIGGAPRWIIDLSPLAHLAPVPAVAVNAGATVALSAVALLLCALGAFAFERRDVVGE
jgi:ABC-2 type transport system permease protein